MVEQTRRLVSKAINELVRSYTEVPKSLTGLRDQTQARRALDQSIEEFRRAVETQPRCMVEHGNARIPQGEFAGAYIESYGGWMIVLRSGFQTWVIHPSWVTRIGNHGLEEADTKSGWRIYPLTAP